MTKGCAGMVRALEELQGHWKFFPVQHMLLYFAIADNDLRRRGLGVMEIAERLDMPQASASRGITDMSARTIPPGSTGPIDLVMTHSDTRDHRKRIPILTSKGRDVYKRIAAHLS